MSNQVEQIRGALSMFARNGTEPALIGDLAVVAHQVVRATNSANALPVWPLRDQPMNRQRHLAGHVTGMGADHATAKNFSMTMRLGAIV